MEDATLKTKEPQYELLFKVKARCGISSFGIMANESWNNDPKRTLFTLSRYKFVAQMLAGKKDVLEVGCADAFGTRLVQQTTGAVTGSDFDSVFIEDARSRLSPQWPLQLLVHDMLDGPIDGTFDAIYSLDVLEHITEDCEDKFIINMLNSMSEEGVLLIGMPSIESQVYASEVSKAGHVNCKNGNDLRNLMLKYFHNVFLFSMNDEVVHTGYASMAHYVLVLCTQKRSLHH